MIKEIYLIRHSAPFVDIDNYEDYKNVNWDDYNRNMILSSTGEKNASLLCNIKDLQNIDEIYSSDSFRAISTAKYLAEYNNIKIKLDKRINERMLGVEKLLDLPDDFTENSWLNKNLKMPKGESLNDVDSRFTEFINEKLESNSKKIVLSIHGIILMSYLQNNCDFNYDGKIFKINFNNKEVINRKFRNPDVFKIVYKDKKIIDIENIEYL